MWIFHCVILCAASLRKRPSASPKSLALLGWARDPCVRISTKRRDYTWHGDENRARERTCSVMSMVVVNQDVYQLLREGFTAQVQVGQVGEVEDCEIKFID